MWDYDIEMVNDVPARVGEVRTDTALGRLDTAENILAKLSALVDRQEPKDLADVWGFCCLWIDAPDVDRYLGDLQALGEGLLLSVG